MKKILTYLLLLLPFLAQSQSLFEYNNFIELNTLGSKTETSK